MSQSDSNGIINISVLEKVMNYNEKGTREKSCFWIDCIVISDNIVKAFRKGELLFESDKCKVIHTDGRYSKIIGHSMKPKIEITDMYRRSGKFICPICGFEEDFEGEVDRYCPECGQYLKISVIPGKMECCDCPEWKFDFPYCGLSCKFHEADSHCGEMELNIFKKEYNEKYKCKNRKEVL